MSFVAQAAYPGPNQGWTGYVPPYAQPVYAPQAPRPAMGYDQYVPVWGQPQPQVWAQPQPQAWPQPQQQGWPQAQQPVAYGAPAQYQQGGGNWAQSIAGFFAQIVSIFRRPPAPAQMPYGQPQVPYGQPSPAPYGQPQYQVPAPLPMPVPMPMPTQNVPPAPLPMPVPMPMPTAPVPAPVPQFVPQAQPTAAIPAIWQGPPGPLEGFDFNKMNDPNHRTVKYAFARSVSGISLASVRDHASGEALLRSLVPRFQSAGMQVLDVSRDKILVVTEIGPEWVDVIRGAGGGNPGWWWGSEGKPTAGVNAPAYVPPHGQPTPLPNMPTPAPAPVPTPGPGPAPAPAPMPGGLPALQTVPNNPEYNVPINKSSESAAILATAQYVKQRYPQFFVDDDRAKHYQAMTTVIGILRANGLDAHRVVNHTSRAMGDPWRYGSDALVLNNSVYDVYRGIGDPNASVPQAMNVGQYGAGRARE